MSYFYLEPWSCGWNTEHLLRITPLRPSPDFITYRQRRLKEAVLAAYDRTVAKKSHVLEAARRYQAALAAVEPVELAVVIADDTIAARPNKDGKYTYRQLPLDHPANGLARHVNDLLFQLHEQKGVTSYIVQAGLPFVPGVAVPGPRRPKLHPAVAAHWLPHAFSGWDDLETQAEKAKREAERAQKYGQPDTAPAWSADTARLLIKAAEAIVTERTARFIAEKVTGRFVCLAPNSPTKAAIKDGIMRTVKGIRPQLARKEHLIDVVGSLSRDGRTTVFDERYRSDYVCSPAVLGELAKRIGNSYAWTYRRRPTEHSTTVSREDEAAATARALEEVLAEYPNAAEIRARMAELNIQLPTIRAILRGLNFDLWHELAPLELEGADIPREQCDASASEVAGALNAVEFFLKRRGYLPRDPDLELLADVGRVCHRVVYDGAPDSWQAAMEQPGVLTETTSRDGLPLTLTIHCQPDLVAWYSGDIGALVLDNKTSATLRHKSRLRRREKRQLALYSLFAERAAKAAGLEAPFCNWGAIVHFRDLQWEDWWITKTPITGRDKESALFKARDMVWYYRRWTGTLPPEAYGREGFRGEPEQFLADYASGPWPRDHARIAGEARRGGNRWTARRIAAIHDGMARYAAEVGT